MLGILMGFFGVSALTIYWKKQHEYSLLVALYFAGMTSVLYLLDRIGFFDRSSLQSLSNFLLVLLCGFWLSFIGVFFFRLRHIQSKPSLKKLFIEQVFILCAFAIILLIPYSLWFNPRPMPLLRRGLAVAGHFLWLNFLWFVLVNQAMANFLKAHPASVGIVLGAKLTRKGQIKNDLKERMDAFLASLGHDLAADAQVILSGGQFKSQVKSEAEEMQTYLLSKGINKERILLEDQSKSTAENIQEIKKILQSQTLQADFILFTSQYHLLRTGHYLWLNNLPLHLRGVAAWRPHRLFDYCREFLAFFYMTKEWQLIIMAFLIYQGLK